MPAEYRDSPRAVYGWAMYDFGNTIFSAVVVTRFFPAYLGEITGRDSWMGAANAFSYAIAAVLAPWLGTLSDRTGRTKRYLNVLTLVCVMSTAALGVSRAPLFLFAAFTMANAAYQASLSLYNSFLPSIASPSSRDRVNGLGVAFGYVGVFVGIGVAEAVRRATNSVAPTFWVASVLFLVSALPFFVFVRERTVDSETPRAVVGPAQILRSLRALRSNRPLRLFLASNFLCEDVLNGFIIFLAVILGKAMGFDAAEITIAQLVTNASACAIGYGLSRIGPRVSPRGLYIGSASALFVLMGLFVIGLSGPLFLVALSFLGGWAVAGIAIASRALLLTLAPPAQVGEYFGLHGLSGKVSSFGALLFALIADASGYRIAIAFQMVVLAMGILCLTRVRLERASASSQ